MRGGEEKEENGRRTRVRCHGIGAGRIQCRHLRQRLYNRHGRCRWPSPTTATATTSTPTATPPHVDLMPVSLSENFIGAVEDEWRLFRYSPYLASHVSLILLFAQRPPRRLHHRCPHRVRRVLCRIRSRVQPSPPRTPSSISLRAQGP